MKTVVSCVLLAAVVVPISVGARYADNFDGHYDDLECAEDDCDCLEPENNNFKVVSPTSEHDTSNEVVFVGAYNQVQKHFEDAGQSDGLPVVPPTPLKAEKFIRYAPCVDGCVIATLNGRKVTAYQVAVNAILSGCAAELMPVCIGLVKAMGDEGWLREIADGKLVPMAFVNGPVGRQLNIDNGQGMTTEEVNVCLGRFIEFALINLAGIANDRIASFGAVRALVFSEDDQSCLDAGWQPYHVQSGCDLNESAVTLTSFGMWGNNITPATDLPEEIMKLIAWDITEKSLGGLGGCGTEAYSGTRRTVLITPPVASALSALYVSKNALEGDLVQDARRPMWMRAFAYYHADTEGVRSKGKSFKDVYDELVATKEEDARITASPVWMNGVTNPKMTTGATLKIGNARILVTGDASRNKVQVVPGGKSVTVKLELPEAWDSLLSELQYKPLSDFELQEKIAVVRAPIDVPTVLPDGTYRILDPATGGSYLEREGRLYFDAATKTLHYFAKDAKSSTVIDTNVYADFIRFIENLGYNSSFDVSSGKTADAVIRFSSNGKKPENNTVALAADAFKGKLTLHANNMPNSAVAGGIAFSGATVILSSSIKSFNVDLDAETIFKGESTNDDFVDLKGTTVVIGADAKAGSKAIIGAANEDGSFRTLTFTMKANGTYEIAYAANDTLSLGRSAVHLEVSSKGQKEIEAFDKTDEKGVYALARHFDVGQYEFVVNVDGASFGNGTNVMGFCDRLPLSNDGHECSIRFDVAGSYIFKFDGRYNKLTVSREVEKVGHCIGGTIEGIAGAWVVRPNGDDEIVTLADLPDDAVIAVDTGRELVPGAAFAGFGEGMTEGAFSLALKPPVIDGEGDDGGVSVTPMSVSVKVKTFANLVYGLKRTSDLGNTFVPVDGEDAKAIGTGESIKLIDKGDDRPRDKAFYAVEVDFADALGPFASGALRRGNGK